MQRERDCRDRLEALFDYLDGELDAHACREIEKHLNACECCGALVESLRRTIAACRVAGAPRLPADIRARAKRRVRALLQAEPIASGGTRARAARRTLPRPRPGRA